MGETDDRGFGDCWVQYQGAFDLGGANTVAGYIHYVVHSAGNPVVAVCVATCAVAGEVVTGVGRVVGVDHALVITIHRTNLAWPRRRNDKVP